MELSNRAITYTYRPGEYPVPDTVSKLKPSRVSICGNALDIDYDIYIPPGAETNFLAAIGRYSENLVTLSKERDQLKIKLDQANKKAQSSRWKFWKKNHSNADAEKKRDLVYQAKLIELILPSMHDVHQTLTYIDALTSPVPTPNSGDEGTTISVTITHRMPERFVRNYLKRKDDWASLEVAAEKLSTCSTLITATEKLQNEPTLSNTLLLGSIYIEFMEYIVAAVKQCPDALLELVDVTSHVSAKSQLIILIKYNSKIITDESILTSNGHCRSNLSMSI